MKPEKYTLPLAGGAVVKVTLHLERLDHALHGQSILDIQLEGAIRTDSDLAAYMAICHTFNLRLAKLINGNHAQFFARLSPPRGFVYFPDGTLEETIIHPE